CAVRCRRCRSRRRTSPSTRGWRTRTSPSPSGRRRGCGALESASWRPGRTAADSPATGSPNRRSSRRSRSRPSGGPMRSCRRSILRLPMRVRFERVTKRFGSHVAADAVDLDVHAGECLVLLGPSGCGKTTLLRLVAGLEALDAGAIWIGDRQVDALEPAQRDVAMVFQNYALYPHLSVFDNIAFPLRTRRVAAAEIDRRVREAAGRVGLGDLLARVPAQLSGGQQQRVALARAIVRSPTVYLLDEPLSNLDAQ